MLARLLSGKRPQIGAAAGLSRALAREPFGNDLGRHGAAKAKPLQGVHPGGAQEQVLFRGFDAFGRYFHPESAPEAHDRMDDRRCGRRCNGRQGET